MATMFERVEATSPASALAEIRHRFPEGARDVRTVRVPSRSDLFREPPRTVARLVEDEVLDVWLMSNCSAALLACDTASERGWLVAFDDGHSAVFPTLCAALRASERYAQAWCRCERPTRPVRVERNDDAREVACEYVWRDERVGTDPGVPSKTLRVVRLHRYALEWVASEGGDGAC